MKVSSLIYATLKTPGMLAIALLIGYGSQAQSVRTWEKTEDDKKELRRFKNNYFHALTFVPFSGFQVYETIPTPDFNNPEILSTQVRGWTFFSLGYQARYNLINHRDWFSISLSAEPFWDIISRGSFEDPGRNVDSNKKGIHLGVDLNLWNHATFNNLDDRGLSVSTGLILNKVAAYPTTRAVYGRLTYKYVKYKQAFWKALRGEDPNKQVSRYIAFQVSRGGDNGGKEGVPYTGVVEYRLVLARIFGY